MQLGGHAIFLHPCVWNRVSTWWGFAMGPTKEQHQICTNLGKSVTETMTVIRETFRERKHELYTESPNSPRPKRSRQVKNKVKGMLIIFSGIKGIVRKEFVL
jgi:hypothetical protein